MDAATLETLEASGLTVGEPLARGRTGRPGVYRGLDRQDRHVAVRLVDVPAGGAGAAVLRRLSLLKGLRHEGIARVREVIAVPGGRAAVTVDLVAGADLAVVLGARGGLTRSEAARLLDDLGSALAHLHAAGLVHGDVAPGNVVVTTDGGAVLIDVVSGVMETGTAGCAAPEVESGAAPTAASDVYGLARLLELCSQGSASLRERLEPILADALREDPDARPTARALAARAPGIARRGAIELPDGARLAAGALRAAAAAPTRQVPSRRARRRGAAASRAPSSRSRRTGDRAVSPGPSGRRLLAGLLAAAAALCAGALVSGALPALDRTEQDAPSIRIADGDVATVTRSEAPTEPSLSGRASSAGGTTAVPGGLRGEGASTPNPTPATSASVTGAASVLTERDALLNGRDPLEAAVLLTAARDEALTSGDAAALATTTVAGGAAARADAALLTALSDAGERVQGLSTALVGAHLVEVPEAALARWPAATGVAVTLTQSSTGRTSATGKERTVPAQPSRDVVLVLVPGPWRVAEVLPAD